MEENQNSSDTATKKGKNLAIPIATIGLIILIVIAFFVYQGQSQNNSPDSMAVTPSTAPVVTSESEPTSPQASVDSTYKDGVYTSTGNYTSPGGAEKIGVTVTLKDGVIEDAIIKSIAERPNTIKFQGIFIQNFEPLVVGKNIDEVKLDKVAGSSLSPKGFNDALEKIKAEAKV